MKLSIVIPHRNSAPELRLCLAALANGLVNGIECIVVDDASSEPIDSIVNEAEFPVRLIRLPVRRGAAAARNRGALEATGEVVVFVDADVCVHRDTLQRIKIAFDEDPTLDALIGSYDDAPSDPGFYSRFRNLFNCYVHHSGRGRAATFWTACGAVRREVFQKHGGFHEHPNRMDDVEFGTRLFNAGRRIQLCPDIQVQHRKSWTFLSSAGTDVWLRGVPWTFIILEYRRMPNTLNLDYRNRLSVALVWLAFVISLAGRDHHELLLAVPVLLVATISVHWPLHRFFRKHGSVHFVLRCIPAHLLHLFLCGFSFLLGIVLFAGSNILSVRPAHSAPKRMEDLDKPIALEFGNE